MPSQDLQRLLRVLDERGIPLGRNDVAWAFESSQTKHETEAWVREYLSESCLLGKEELSFHEQHGKNTSKSVFPGRPLADADFEAAISSLESSTAAIEQQSKLLQAQKKALQNLKSRHSADETANQAHAQRLKKLAREKTQVEFEGNEISGSLQSRLQSLNKQIDVAYSGLNSGVDRVLEKDDRLLDGLQGLLPKLEADGQDDGVSTEVERLCQALKVLSTREIRARIDAAYTVTRATEQTDPNAPEADKDHIASLRDELNELTTEIDGLVTMSIENHHRTPILHALSTNRSSTEASKFEWTAYIAQTIHHLTTRLEDLTTHIENLHAHKAAVSHVSALFDTTTAPLKPTRNASPTKQAMQTPKPQRIMQMQGKSSSETQDPAAALLRNLDIRGTAVAEPSKLPALLARTNQERQTRLADLESSTATSIADQIADALAKADKDVLDLLAAVHIHSSHGQTRIADADLEKKIDGLEAQTQEAGKAMRDLRVDEITNRAFKQLQETVM